MPITAILAGGLATRLGSLAASTPKSMLVVAGKPFIVHQLRLLAEQGLPRVVICASHFADQIQELVGDGSKFECEVQYSLDGKTQLDTGGALRRALPLLGDKFLVMYGDSYLRELLSPVWKSFVESEKAALMTIFRNEDRWDASNVDFVDGEILRYEKTTPGARQPGLQYIDYGLGCIRSEALAEWPLGKRFSLAEFYQAMLKTRQLAAWVVKERFYEIGSASGLADTEEFLARAASEAG